MTTSTFATLRSKHTDTLRRCEVGPITPELIKEVERFIETVRQAGRDIADEDDREYLRSLLTFWGNWFYNQTRKYPNTNLELVTPEVAAAHGRDVAAKIVKGAPVGSRTQNRLLIGGGVVMLGLVALIASAALVVATLPLLFGSGQISPTQIAVAQTVAAITTETAIAGVQAATQQPPATAVVVSSATPAPTLPATLTLTVPPPVIATSTRVASGLPTPTPEFGIGGGGFTPDIGFLSVQVVEPAPDESFVVGQPFNIGAAYSNLQPGWTLFYVFDPLLGGDSFVASQSFEVGDFDGTGLWTESVQLDQPGYYNIGVFIATSADSRQQLQPYAEAGAPLPDDFNFEGIIVFRGLTTMSVN